MLANAMQATLHSHLVPACSLSNSPRIPLLVLIRWFALISLCKFSASREYYEFYSDQLEVPEHLPKKK